MDSKSSIDKGILVPKCAVPAFPGAMYNWSQPALCASFQARAFSLPPDPNKSIFIKKKENMSAAKVGKEINLKKANRT